MSSNIRVNRICQQCSKPFEARTTVTAYCGTPCAKRAYKARARAKKINTSDEQTRQVIEKPIEAIRAKEFLTVRDAARLLNCSRATLYLAIQSGRVPAVNLAVKKTLIRRADIDKLFDPGLMPAAPEAAPVALSDCYSFKEIYEKYGINDRLLYTLINRNNIPKQYVGSRAFVPKSIIDHLLNDLIK